MQQSVDDEVPARAVPEADRDERDHQVDVHVAVLRAADRPVEVLAEEAGHGDVPALPEARNRPREVRPVEVDGEVVAEAPGRARAMSV